MDLGEILRVMRNRWYVMLPMMLLAAGLTAMAYLMVPTQYESHSTISLLSAERASTIATEGNQNPFLTFDSSLVATADFLSRSLLSNDSTLELRNLGVTEEYTAGLADNAQGPFVTLTVIGTDRDHVLAATSLLTQYADRKLREIQADSGVKDQDMVRMIQITPPQTPDAKVKDKFEVVIGAAGAGTVLAFVLTFVTEGLARSRRRGKGSRSAAAEPTTALKPIVPSGQASGSVPVRGTTVRSASAAADPEHTVSLPDQTLMLPRAVQLEFTEARVRRPATDAKPADPKPADGKTPAEDSTELLLLGPGGPVAMKPNGTNGSSSSTVYRSTGTPGLPRDADPNAGH